VNFKVQSYQRMRARQKTQGDELTAYCKKVAERDIQKYLCDLCEAAQIPYTRNRDVRLVQSRDGKWVPGRIRASQKGKPDLFVFGLDRNLILIETKAPSGKLSDDQIRWRDLAIARGYEYHAPRTVSEAHVVGKRILEIGR